MKIDLLKICEENKKIEELKEEVNLKKELRNLISAIIKNNDNYTTDSKKLVEELKVKYKEEEICGHSFFDYGKVKEYKIKLTKENIKKIQKYIDKEN